jgi:hypothetical protein
MVGVKRKRNNKNENRKGGKSKQVQYNGARCWWRSWLRHCATSRKVAGSIPNGVIGIFH